MNNHLLLLILILVLFEACNSEANQSTSSSQKNPTNSTRSLTSDYNPDKNAYFGDLHIHSGWSFDAFIYNVRTDPGDAYMYAKGMPIESNVGRIQMKRPLDFASVTDHSEYLGVMMQMINPESPLAQLEFAQKVRSEDRNVSVAAFGEVGQSLAYNTPIEELADEAIMSTTWQKAIEIANEHYEPGVFTSFPGYEWTSSPQFGTDPDNLYAANLHRNIIYKGDKVSSLPFSSFNSQDPEELWKWMEKERAAGVDLLAIPHNANMSDGLMFPKETFSGRPIDEVYVKLRARHEPIQEVVQVKGQSMSHPLLHPNDEFADFEIYAYTFALGAPPPSRPQGSNIREAYQKGLEFQEKFGVNPYRFGLIGSSDTHNSGGTIEEDNYTGKFGGLDGTPKQRIGEDGNDAVVRFKHMSAAGLAGVWAEENTRESIYHALKTKETYATSGTRIQVRLFVGPELKDVDINDDNWVEQAYKKGAPMGTTYIFKEQPTFIAWATKDVDGANLDRIQMIKSWLDKSGETHEKIFNLAWSDDRTIDESGDIPPVGNTVNVRDASYTNTIGSVSLSTKWQDPEFDPEQHAVYFLRVLEIPTPRWSTYDAKELGIEIPDNLDATIQERAWSSPVWYNVR